MTALHLRVDPPDCADKHRGTALEWLEVNGRGGYASGTVSGLATRKYHGLLLAASHPPHRRLMLVNHLVERIELGSSSIFLSSDEGEPPEDGYRRCTGFAARPFPRWEYRIGDATVVRSILCPWDRQAVVIRWDLLGARNRTVRLAIRPMLTGRRDHDVFSAADLAASGAVRTDRGVSWQPRPDFLRVHADGDFSYLHGPAWRRGVTYAIDRERGEACTEDWWSPGELAFELTTDRPTFLTLAVEPGLPGAEAFASEVARRRERDATIRLAGNALYEELAVTAESHLAELDDGGAAIMAGIPWFNVWTRDAFTALGGLLIAMGRFDMAARVIRTFAPLVEGGLLPNDLPDEVTKPVWTSVDASLWFIVSVGRLLASDDGRRGDLAAAAWPAVRGIVEGYAAGTAHRTIEVEVDGLVRAASQDDPLTWMDAKFEGQVMTPRRGKPVEVQALWVRALAVAATLGRHLGDVDFAATCEQRRARAIASFQQRYWFAEGGYLYDVVDGPDGDDASLRPNQLFAVSLDPDLVPEPWARSVVEVTRRRLLTTRGLRTLPVDDPRFRPTYTGPRALRDAAYHQGTVWPFLLGPFVSAWLRVEGNSPAARREALTFLKGIEQHVATEGCLGHVSEIFDGVAPHAPRGCFAQAWSLGEILHALRQILEGS